MTTTLRDRENKVIGRIEESSNRDVLVGRTPENKVVGRYDPDTDKTYDNSGRVVGTGNLLSSLLR